MNKTTIKPHHYIIAILSVMFIGFNVLRIINVSITHDEGLTYYIYLLKPYKDIISNYHPSANNHFLNSIFSKASISAFGDNIVSLRLPALLSQLVYIIYSWLLAERLFKQPVFILCVFLLLQLNPFLFEFWGLSRGYALSIACLAANIYYLLCYIDSKRLIMLFMSLLFLSAGIYSGFYLLNYAMAFLVVVAFMLIVKASRATLLKAAAMIIITAAGLYMLMAENIKTLKEKGELYYGGDEFIKDTMGSFIRYSFHLKETNSSIYWIRKIKKENFTPILGASLWVLLVIPALSIIVQHYLLGTKYLLDRTALFFYPLFIMMIAYTIKSIGISGIFKNSILILFTAGSLINFSLNFNFSSTSLWGFDAHTPWLMEKMVKEKKNPGEIKIYLDWLFTPSLTYYTERKYPNKFGYLESQNEIAYEPTDYDFYLIRAWGYNKVPDIYVLDTVFCDSTYYLFKRKTWDNDSATVRQGFLPKANRVW